MTGDEPNGAELLATAACSLREEILHDVPRDHRLTLLMALSAMGIAERELRDRDAQKQASSAAGPGALARARIRRICDRASTFSPQWAALTVGGYR